MSPIKRRTRTAAPPVEEPAAVVPTADATPEGEVAPEVPRDERRKWYVIHTYSGYENKVKANLEHRIESMGVRDKIFQVVVPTEEEIEIKDGQRRTVQRKVFPGYVLVEMIMSDDAWYVVRNTPGVTGFVGAGNRPTPLDDEEAKRILKKMKVKAEPTVRVTFSRGERVKVIDGPFTDFIGVVDDINPEKGKVRVLVSFFGRETPVELDFLQVARIT
ncbi:MAG: transcription termination/antitermination protein NusG [Chloroflexi bacterium]|jgi:transcriptional antiterminator NusG|nr:transcription termination/antitermination protein NusG [Chloroflexota bacterium]